MDLTKGRISIPDARYFITLSAVRPTQKLTHPDVATVISQTIRSMVAQQDAQFLCTTIMPDHIHLLIKLGHRLTVNRLTAKLKAQTHSTLLRYAVNWQRNFFEHRLRPDESSEAYARYIFLNPYRDGLISRTAEWPFWKLDANHEYDFCRLLEEGRFPPIEWISADFQKLGLAADSVGTD